MLKSRRTGLGRLIVVLVALLALAPLSAFAQRESPQELEPVEPPAAACTFTEVNGARLDVWTLNEDCTTSQSIVIPHATKLDGAGHTIWAVDPDGATFAGGVITNEPPVDGERVTIYVTNVKISAGGLAVACNTYDERLRGVWLNRASGAVTNVTILALNQADSGCQGGNGIDASNVDGSYWTNVTIANNTVLNWQKRGIQATGKVRFRITDNFVGGSTSQAHLAPNGIQVYLEATGSVLNNNVHGNNWEVDDQWAGSSILIYEAGSVRVVGNTVNENPAEGNTDVGISITDTDNSRFVHNTISDYGTDSPNEDIGIQMDCESTDNLIAANQISGFDEPTDICGDGRPL